MIFDIDTLRGRLDGETKFKLDTLAIANRDLLDEDAALVDNEFTGKRGRRRRKAGAR